MIVADTTRYIRMVLSGAMTTNQLPIAGDYLRRNVADMTRDDQTPIHTVSNSTTEVTVLPAGESGYVNELLNLSIYNADTVAATVSVKYFDGTNDRVIIKVTLAVDDALHYESGRGWYVLDVNGNTKSGGMSTASTTEVLTGTDASKAVTTDALAALWEQGGDIASSGTISVGEGGVFSVTGTTTITDIDFATDKAGRCAWLKFTGILTLTHNATTLILPTGANITTAAGDTALFTSEGSDVVRCLSYNRANGGGAGSGWVQISEGTASASASIAFTGLSTVYRMYAVLLRSVAPATDNVSLGVQQDTNGGASYTSSGYVYHYGDSPSSGTAYAAGNSTGASSLILADSLGNASGELTSGWFYILNHGSSNKMRYTWHLSATDTGGATMTIVGAGQQNNENGPIDAIKFAMSSGNIASGTFTLYGIM